MIYEYAIISEPKKQKDKREKAVVIVPITSVLADSEDQARIIASRAIPDEWVERLDEVVIAVRPF